jgi:hypothetical protein
MIDSFNNLPPSVLLFLIFVYLVGFTINNTHLLLRGLDEYQLLSAYYLSDGVYFLLMNFLSILIGMLPSLFLIEEQTTGGGIDPLVTVVLFGISFITPFVLTFLNVKKYRWSFHKGLLVLFITGLVGNILPSYVLSLYILTAIPSGKYQFQLDVPGFSIMVIFAIASWFLNMVIEMTYYSYYVYGKEARFLGERFGLRIFQLVQFVYNQEHTNTIKRIGIPSQEPGITGVLHLIASTSDHYIVSIPPDSGPTAITDRTVKIAKGLIVAILYIPKEETIDLSLNRTTRTTIRHKKPRDISGH